MLRDNFTVRSEVCVTFQSPFEQRRRDRPKDFFDAREKSMHLGIFITVFEASIERRLSREDEFVDLKRPAMGEHTGITTQQR